MPDTIKKFSKSKGYESIPRELLQSKEISLEAIGLMCNLQSYPDSWVLHKTELRKRFLNKEKVVDRIWDELVEHNYVLQFRKRVGRKYEYEYFFNVNKFSVEEIQELLEGMYLRGMSLYHKGMIGKDEVDLRDYLFIEKEDLCKLDLSIWGSQNGNSKECDDNGVSWGSQYGNSKMDIPKQEGNRFTNKRLTIKENDDDEIKGDDSDSRFFDVLMGNKELAATSKFLFETGISMDIVKGIILELNDRPYLINGKNIVRELRWCAEKIEKGDSIGDFVGYFIRGLEMSREYGELKRDRIDTGEYYGKVLRENKRDFKGILHNWLEN